MTTEEKIAEVERLLRELEEELPDSGTLTIELPQLHKRWRLEYGYWDSERGRYDALLEYWKSSTMDC